MITVSAIDAAIDALVSAQQVNYSVGDKSFQNGDKLRQLMELRATLAASPEVELECMTFDSAIELSGKDNTQRAVP